MAYTIIIRPQAEGDLQYSRVNEQRIIIAGIQKHLVSEPHIVSKRKKHLRPNDIAPWELRIDIYRVFYMFDNTTVFVVAVGHKIDNKLYIRGKEVDL